MSTVLCLCSFRLFRNRGDGAATAFINSRAEAQTPQREIATSCGSVTLYKHWITIKGGQSPVFESLESENIVENDTLADVDEGNSVPVAFMEIRNVSKSNSMVKLDFRTLHVVQSVANTSQWCTLLFLFGSL